MQRDLRTATTRPDLIPLRYPGGKRRLILAVADLLERSRNPIKLLVEPFAGGAAVSVTLMECGFVEEIALADKDEMVAAFWKVVFSREAGLLAEQIRNAEVTVAEWKRLKHLQRANAFQTDLERAYACLFLNRTSFSGILHRKVGPIGGPGQTSKYKIDCRFNRESLSNRIVELSRLRSKVRFVRHQGYERTISDINKSSLARETPQHVAWYLDPPFFEKADRLYRHVFTEADHLRLQANLKRLRGHWILSYDNVEQARKLYAQHPGYSEISLMYSARISAETRTAGNEIVVSDIIATLRATQQAAVTPQQDSSLPVMPGPPPPSNVLLEGVLCLV